MAGKQKIAWTDDYTDQLFELYKRKKNLWKV